MIKDMMAFITGYDPEVGAAIEKEYVRQRRNIELIASENYVSEAVLLAAGTVLTNKYAEGYPGHRYYGGCEEIDVVETIAIERAKKLFGAKLSMSSPIPAFPPITRRTCADEPGDTVLGMNLITGPSLPRQPGQLLGQILQYRLLRRHGRYAPYRLRPGARSGKEAQAPDDRRGSVGISAGDRF